MIWFSAALLAFEASSVITKRLFKMGSGDMSENHLMVTEKIGAAFEACAILASGGDASKVIDSYRKHVALNAERLE